VVAALGLAWISFTPRTAHARNSGEDTNAEPRSTLCRRRHKVDLRHSLAVRTLIGWLRDGQDVAARMSVLSSYLGHVNPAGTYWYFSAAPELMDLAAARLNDRLGAPR
jgi:hypothetical protein